MKPTLLIFVSLLCFTALLSAAPKDFTVSGNQKIVCEFDGQNPLPVQKDGLTIHLPAFAAREGEFAYQFEVDSVTTPSRIIIEDVTEATARVLCDVSSPRFDKGYWMTVTPPIKLSKESLPWIFSKGDTTRIFRFTFTMADKADAIVLYQPEVWVLKAKKYLRTLAK